ncbi:hypothetical protein JS61_07630 (plasmid) [Rickettsia felis]|nr:hypothetical protein JS61_07630 [Rickettsia felis]
MIYPKTAVFDNVENDTPIDIPASNSVVNTTNENTVWNQIRKGLREELGEAVDETWFFAHLMLLFSRSLKASWFGTNASIKLLSLFVLNLYLL